MKEIKLARLPKILILSLQKFDYKNNIKKECSVDFHEIPDINEYLDNDIIENKNRIYKLYAVINHIGVINFGHYTSFAKLYNDAWYLFDDTDVKQIQGKPKSENEYILFYILEDEKEIE